MGQNNSRNNPSGVNELPSNNNAYEYRSNNYQPVRPTVSSSVILNRTATNHQSSRIAQIRKTHIVKSSVMINLDSVMLLNGNADGYILKFDYTCKSNSTIAIFVDVKFIQGGGSELCPVVQSCEVPFEMCEVTENSGTFRASHPIDFRHNIVLSARSPMSKKTESYMYHIIVISGHPAEHSVVPKISSNKIIYKNTIFSLYEVFGTNKPIAAGDEESRECVICMSEDRTTAVLPCRHMCMCNSCAEQLRSSHNKCPICREHVSSLLQVK